MARVRLSGGEFRGRTLPVGPAVRPTEGRVREALFSIWGPRIRGGRVLDLFAGSGAVGIEAVGRGAEAAVLVDGDRSVVRALGESVGSFGLEDRVRVHHLSLPRGLGQLARSLESPVDLVFADPPYRFVDHDALIDGVAPLLDADGELVIEHRSSDVEIKAPPDWRVADRRIYGECSLTFFHRI